MLVRFLPFVPALVGLSALIYAVNYCATNCSGHTSVSPHFGNWIFLPVLLVGLVLLRLPDRTAAWAALLTGGLGVGFGFYVQSLGIMQDYGTWIRNGMPDQNPRSVLLLLLYLGVGVGSLISVFVPRLSGARS